MKVHLISLSSIRNYTAQHQNNKTHFEDYRLRLQYADWNHPLDIVKSFPSADLLGNGSDRVIFNIGGNDSRLICQYNFGKKEVHLYICWIGTHADYTKLCAKNLQYTVSDY